jgi:hypothetical protein
VITPSSSESRGQVTFEERKYLVVSQAILVLVQEDLPI